MSYERFITSLDPVFYAPFDMLDVDDKFTEDIVTFSQSEDSDASLVFVGGIANEEESVSIDTPIEFDLLVGSVDSMSVGISVPPETIQDIVTTDDRTVSVSSGESTATISIDGQESPPFPVGYWHQVVKHGASWDILDLEVESDQLLVQHLAMYDYELSSQQVEDFRSIAVGSFVKRQISSQETIILSDSGPSVTVFKWHIVST